MAPGQAFLTQNDVQNYGSDLVDFAQRAAIHATAPQLAQLDQQNAELERQLAIERRKRLDQQLEQELPNYREIDNDPRWHQWLLGVHELSGRVRQEWLNDAIARGDAQRVIQFFRGFLSQHAVDRGQTPTARHSGPVSADINNTSKSFTRQQIAALYERHRRGKLTGAEWERTEEAIIRAARENRVIGAVDPYGR